MALDAISSVGGDNSAPEPAKRSPGVDADFNTFLKLLIAQLKNQDPTNPTDPTQFVSQLASFSALEKAAETNEILKNVLITEQVSSAQGYVGKYIHYKDDTVEVSGQVVSISIYSDGVVAVLDNGKKIVLGPGVEVSSTPFSPEPEDDAAKLATLVGNVMRELTPASPEKEA